MASPSADTLHTAVRLRASISQLTRHLRAQSAESAGSARLSVLGQLYRRGPLSPTELALHERVKLQTLTRLLAEIGREGLIERRADTGDARKSILSLTDAGARLLGAEVHRRETSLAAAIAECLSKGERADLLAACELIDRVAQSLELPPRSQPAPPLKA
ncbi:homoprotocatechuate degradation operon regulator, HpaR [Variovorax sp. PBS-H4]|uniref:MarR family winged helix-turn-helix transcriptional regulator n=1 Tax=Variovorax sp. PBS-H4 TaxID=434008 RepID=UPI0013167A6D|nr:MarR family transcriptional regulator [Variovorax sp. PBS-H4]VTU38133.1 homoprotocatechuate degradation operon regulator, HpaR [Variovorax sp. PBS-H4]